MVSVHVLGSYVYVIYDGGKLSVKDLLEHSGVKEYYMVKVLEKKEGSFESLLREVRPSLGILL